MKLGIALIALLVLAVVAVVLLRKFLRRRSYRNDFLVSDRKAWQKRWIELEVMLQEGESHWQVAIFEADKLFDRVLKSMHLPGTTMGERLKFLTHSRPELRFVWPAHLTRNKLAHEPSYRLTQRHAVQTLQTFKRALKELGIL